METSVRLEPPGYQLDVVSTGSRAVVSLPARLDPAARDALWWCASRLAVQGVRELTLDAARLQEVDAPGLAALVRIARLLRSVNGRLVLASLHHDVSRLLAVAGLHRIFGTQVPAAASS